MLTVMKGIVRAYFLLFSPILLLVLAGGYLLGNALIERELYRVRSDESTFLALASGRLDDELAVPLRSDALSPALTAFTAAGMVPAPSARGTKLTVTMDAARAGDNPRLLLFHHLNTLARNGGTVGNKTVRSVMDDHPMSCTPETELDQVRPMMLEKHTRYMPVMDNKMLMGVISFYDVAKAVVDSQNFENKMLKAYIRDWPEDETGKTEPNFP